MSITYWKTPITSLTTSKNNIIITDNSFDPRFYSLSLYMLVSTLVTYYSNMSTSSSTTYLSATIPTTSTTSPTSLLLTLSSAQPPATSSNCTFYSLKMLLMTILASILVTLSATMGTSNSSCGCPGPSGLCLKFINAKTIEQSWVGCVGNLDLLMHRKFSETAVVPNSELGNRSNLHSP